MAKKITLHAADREIGKAITALKKLAGSAEPADRKEIQRRLKKLADLRKLAKIACTKSYNMWPPSK